jgi:hemerythrin-like metal-binding protein
MLDRVTFHHLKGSTVRDILDRQHTEIKKKHQNLRTALIEGTEMDRIINCSKELITSALLHFKSEESAMDAMPSQSFAKHRHLHAEMIESLEDISIGLEQRRIHGAMELMKFFEGRLAFHLDVEDTALERDLNG